MPGTEDGAAVGRARTYGWDDPAPTAAAFRELPGLELLRAMIDGRLPAPPIGATFGMALVEVDEGRAVFEVEPSEFHCNPAGGVHGGLALTLVDSATGCALQTVLPAGALYTTLETKVNFVRAMTAGMGLVRCTGETLHVGRSTATAQARVVDSDGRLLAHGSSTLIILGR